MKSQKKHLKLFYFLLTMIAFFLISCLVLLNIIQKINTEMDAELSAIHKEYAITRTKHVTGTATTTPTIIPSPTKPYTHTPEEKKYDPTPTTTPYPTFIVKNVVRATPGQPALCPVEDPGFEINPESFYWEDPFMLSELLSMGASFSQIKKLYANAGVGNIITVKDMTNDGVDELIYLLDRGRLKVISCEAGEFKTLVDAAGECARIVYMKDMNLNGIPDLVFSYSDSYSSGGCDGSLAFDVYEWNGQTMEQMEDVYHGDVDNLELLFYTETMEPNTRMLRGLFFYYPFDWGQEGVMLGNVKMDVVDLDYDGTKEIRMKYTDPSPDMQDWREEPLRTLELIFEWNGEKYLFSNAIFGPPEYRFQAVQDADRYFLFRQYDEALAMYDVVINSTTLKPWSEEYIAYLDALNFSENFSFKSDPVTEPVMTLDEYQQLSAYARYRIMMIQLAQGKQSEALNTYQLLNQIYTEQNPGYAHAEIGRKYWKAVDEGQNLVEACQTVRDYIQENQDLLPVLGDGRHGEQSHTYSMNDICPLDETDLMLLSGNQ